MALAQPTGYQTGSYIVSITSGVLGATLAADSPIFGIRCGPTQTEVLPTAGIITKPRFIYITEIALRVNSVVAFTAAQQFGLYMERFSVANLAGGADALISKVNETGAPLPTCTPGGAEAGDARVATTATLTSAGVTFDGKKIPIYGWSTVGPADYGFQRIQCIDNPIRLGLGEGLSIRNSVVWPAAGTGFVTGYCKFDERSV